MASDTQFPDINKIKNKLALSRFLVSSFLAGLGGSTLKEKQAIIKAIGAVRKNVKAAIDKADTMDPKILGAAPPANRTTTIMWKHMLAEAGHQDREHLSGMLNTDPDDLPAKTREYTAGTPQRYLGEAVGILSAEEKDVVKRLLNEN